MEFVDAIKEGDGERVIRCWKFLLIIFHNSNRKNYAKEAILLLHQYQYLITPQQAERIIYSRFINVAGLPGKNISSDLHMEHLNKILKNGIGALASNKTEESIVRLGKAIGTVAPVLQNFDAITGIQHHQTRHKPSSMKKDIMKVVESLHRTKIFSSTPGRKFPTFPNPKSLLHKQSSDEIISWIQTHV